MKLIDADELIDAIDEVDWYHINKQGELVHGANSKLGDQPLYKSQDIYEAIWRQPLKADACDTSHWIPRHINSECAKCGGRGAGAFKFCPWCGRRMTDEVDTVQA